MSIQSPATAHTAGNAPATEDLGPLAWVLGEIQKTLDGVGKTLRRFAREAATALPGSELDTAPLRQARLQLHQAVGALQMVGHTAPALVLGAMEFAVQSFASEPLRCNEAAVQKIDRAGFAVADFLNAMIAGKVVSSVALFPQYREVLELVGNERVHPADLWSMTWRWVEIKPAPTQTALVYDPAVRSKLDREVLKVVKSGDDHAARRLQALCLGLGRGASVPRVASFWTLAAGFFEALALALIPADAHVKRAASRVLLQYATLARGDNTVSDRLGQDLLFFCAQAVPGPRDEAATLRAVRIAWGVANEQTVDYTIEQFGRFDPLVLAQARKRIESAKEMWSALSGGDVSRTRQVADTFVQLGESLQKLHPPSAPMVQALNNAVEASLRSGQPPATELAMEVATSVLYLEAAFEDLDPHDRQLTARTVQLAGRIERARDGGRSEPLEPWMEELYRRVSDRQTMGTVVGELRSHLSELEKSLDQFFRRPTEKSLLRTVPNQLLQMRGVFSVLGLDQAAQTVQRMRENVDQLMAEESPADEIRAFDSLGNNLGALGFLIDMLSYQPALAKRLFVFDAELGELKPLMGRQAAEAGAPEAAAPAPSFASASGPVAVTDTVLSVEEVDAQIAAKLAALAAPGGRSKPAPSPIEEFSRATASWTAKITGPAPLDGLMPDTEVTELEEDDLQNIFLDEAREVLHNGLAAVSALSSRPDDDGELTVLRRAFHTLKGSSRMVGLMDFGEAAWSFEQVLNTWLADQRPATPELIAGTRSALTDFAKWVEAIAANQPHGWQSAPFRSMAEALRSGEPLAPTPRVADADALVAAARHIAADSLTEAAPPAVVPEAPLPLLELPELPDLELGPIELDLPAVEQPVAAAPVEPAPDAEVPTVWSGLQEASREEDAPRVPDDFASTDFLDFDGTPAPEAPLDLGTLEDVDFLETVHTSLEPVARPAPVESEAEPALSFELRLEPEAPAEPPQAVETAPEPEAEPEPMPEPEPEPVLEVEPVIEPLSLAPVAQAAETEVEPEPQPEPEPEPVVQAAAAEVEAPAAAPPIEIEPERPALPSAEEQVKVIGPLRIGIALYNVYLNEADEWSRQLATEVGEWALESHQRVADSTIGLAHSLAGSSATVGFQSLSGMARLLEAALQHLQMQGRGTPQQGAVLVGAAEELRRLLHQFAAGVLKDPVEGTLRALREVAASVLPAEPLDTRPVYPHLVRDAMADVALDDSEDAIDLADAVDVDLFPIFEEEAAELLPQLGAALRDWAQRPEDTAPRSSTLRTLHTLKGSARLAGAMRLGERAHRMESEIEMLGSAGVDRDSIEKLLVRFDALQATFDGLRAADDAIQTELVQRAVAAPASPQPVEPPPLAAVAVAEAPAAVAAPAADRAAVALPSPSALTPLRGVSSQAVRIRTHLLDRLVAQAGEVIITRSRLEAEIGQLRSSLSDLTGNLDRLRQQLRDIEVQAESQMQSRLAQAKDSQQGFDPLEFDRFTRVQELTRMMAESVNDVATVQRTLQKTVQATEDDLSAQARQTRELQRGLLRTRMVEFEGISERLYRVVRQASKDTGKQVRLDITGGSIEMDRGVLDRMTPAFEHLLRNCVAHGIEDAATRERAGKEASGLIAIELHHEGNDVSVSFRDDGAGLNHARIVERAQALGLVAQGQSLSPAEAAELIFQPGFSTADQVSELAGRGIGMDVVRAEVAALGGRIETHSQPGQGTVFKLVLPLTTAVTHVVMLRAGGTSIGVPSNLVELVLRASASDLESAYIEQRYPFGGEQVPFYWAGALLQSSARSERAPAKANTIVVVRSAAQRVALHVDEVLGNQEVVVKNLGPQLSRLPGMAAISVLASGAVALIYNPVALAAVHGEQAREFQAAARRQPALRGAEPVAVQAAVVPQVPLVLVVDDSITVRRVTQRLLQREGYRVALAADGLQALERLQQERPAVVLSDIEMPRMDGFDLARNIRADQSLADLPIIMITSRIAEKHHDHARALGVNHYLGKPYSEDELLRLVRSYTGVDLPAVLAA
ncbi:hybrid sensor histidine kinase/response regulator [Variovorax ginsengisoli]|uniref:histidine kinase n=1 Tax=Variovorax ginsengisoli TaxID=363844 RepID=A0ABT8S2G5_9BURK|nr:Hpt domain-containing protein [Variovorax ginsengisoli]MDN8613229.1 Hpt domain-containing protein [Variovorax ginsengisoli]MDO1532399.1 Hpt domain-containing protein [Variovorax ginsengisoli]